MELDNLLRKVEGEQDGFSFGEKWRHSESSLGLVVPILRTTDKARDYVTLEEAKKDAIQVSDSGSISKVKVISNTDSPVFIRVGTIMKGDTQARGVEASIVVMPQCEMDIGKKTYEPMPIEIPVRCVHQSHGISSGARMRACSMSAPRSVQYAFMSKAGQGSVWDAVETYSSDFAELGVSGRHDDLVGTIEQVGKFKKDVTKAIKNIPTLENQVGAIIFDTSKVVGLELFDHPKSWAAFHKDVIEKYADILVKKEEALFEIKSELIPGKIKDFLKRMRGGTTKEIYNSQDQAKTYSLEADGVIGEYTVINGKIMHVLGVKKEDTPAPKKQRTHGFDRVMDDIMRREIDRDIDNAWGRPRRFIPYQDAPYEPMKYWSSSENKIFATLKSSDEPLTISATAKNQVNYNTAKDTIMDWEKEGIVDRVEGKKYRLSSKFR